MFGAADIDAIRKQFPILERKINGQPLVYFDNASTVQKPNSVLEGIHTYYSKHNSNVHRGVHTLSQEASSLYEKSRIKTAAWLGCEQKEIVFTSGTTDGINLVAHGFVKHLLNAGDEIIVSEMEHHSNIVPWQIICEEKKAGLQVVKVDEHGQLQMDHFHSLLNNKTRFI